MYVQASTQALEEYQRLNTIYFQEVLPSLDIYSNTRYWKEDFEKLESFTVVTSDQRMLGDGNGVVNWVRKFVAVDSIAKQAELRHTVVTKKLKENATISDMMDHIEDLWECWLLLTGSDKTQPMEYFELLLASWPIKVGSMQTTTRNELATEY